MTASCSASRAAFAPGDGVIATRSPGYLLEPSIVDAVAFEDEVSAARGTDAHGGTDVFAPVLALEHRYA